MIDNGKPFVLDELKKTFPWKTVIQRKGVLKMTDRFGREVDLADMLNFLEYTTQKVANATQK